MKLHHLTTWYTRNERLISSFSLFGGFVFDAVTLKRVDLFWENLWVGAHLIVAAVGILLINLYENKKGTLSETASSRIHFWLIIIIQFAFGGLLSTFLVFYFRSGTIATSWPFLALLVVFFVFNELLKHHYSRLVFQTSVLFISIYSFAIFITPVILHQIGSGIFIISGLASLIILRLFLYALQYMSKERFLESRRMLIFSIGGLTLLINILYFTNLIPPIPLSLKDAGVYHSLQRTADGNYTVTEEPSGFWSFFQPYQPINLIAGEPVYVYTSIFSPTRLNTTIIHNWQHYDVPTDSWITSGTIPLDIVGGREDGYRTYSVQNPDLAGLWRVDVTTPQNQLIGRVTFEITTVSSTPDLITTTL